MTSLLTVIINVVRATAFADEKSSQVIIHFEQETSGKSRTVDGADMPPTKVQKVDPKTEIKQEKMTHASNGSSATSQTVLDCLTEDSCLFL